jgi:hypothetical protein
MSRAFRALVLAGSALALTVSVAAAAGPFCNYPSGSNTCLTVTPVGLGVYALHVGIDIEKGSKEAQDILNAAWAKGLPALTAQLVGDDGRGTNDTALFAMPITPGWPQVGAGALSAEFDITVGSGYLNEDTDGRDELYARVTLHDYRFGLHRITVYTSGVHVGYY